MSGRFVRASKYRHVHGQVAKKDKAFQGVRTETTGEGNHICASTAYWAVALPGGGGPVLAWPHTKYARMEASFPKVNVHRAKVVDLEFSPFAETLLATASEDGTVKLTMLPAGGLQADITQPSQTLEGHQKKLSLVRWNPTASNIIASAAYDNVVKVWDAEKGKEIASIDEHPEFPISMEWNEDGSMLATSCKDKYIRMFDPRKKGPAVKSLGLEGTKGQRVVWLHGHNKLASIGFQKNNSRGYAMFDCKKFDAPLGSADIDNSVGILIPYFDPDTSMLYLAGKGDAGIKYYEIVNDEPYIHFLSEFRETESLKGACFLPKTMCDTKTCEVAVCYRVMKDWISPVSFQVPRKSDMFQHDIYPDTYAARPVTTADEWAAGTNRSPLKRSMKPGAAAPDAKVAAFKAEPKPAGAPAVAASASSAAVKDLEAALEKANQRIKELEAENAKLKAAAGANAPAPAPEPK